MCMKNKFSQVRNKKMSDCLEISNVVVWTTLLVCDPNSLIRAMCYDESVFFYRRCARSMLVRRLMGQSSNVQLRSRISSPTEANTHPIWTHVWTSRCKWSIEFASGECALRKAWISSSRSTPIPWPWLFHTGFQPQLILYALLPWSCSDPGI